MPTGLGNCVRDDELSADDLFEPSYLKLHGTGELKKRGAELWAVMKDCRLCPRECGADRISGDRGFCGASAQLEISSFHPHFGEERSLVGHGGSLGQLRHMQLKPRPPGGRGQRIGGDRRTLIGIMTNWPTKTREEGMPPRTCESPAQGTACTGRPAV